MPGPSLAKAWPGDSAADRFRLVGRRWLTRVGPTLRLDLVRFVERHRAEAGPAPERRIGAEL